MKPTTTVAQLSGPGEEQQSQAAIDWCNRPSFCVASFYGDMVVVFANMKSVLEPQDLLPNYQAALAKKIPVHSYLEDTAPAGEVGRLCLVGAIDGTRGRLRDMEHFWDPNIPQTRDAMWTLPQGLNGEDVEATSNSFHISNDQELPNPRPLPLVRYKSQSASKCDANDHPNNQNGSGWVDDFKETRELLAAAAGCGWWE